MKHTRIGALIAVALLTAGLATASPDTTTPIDRPVTAESFAADIGKRLALPSPAVPTITKPVGVQLTQTSTPEPLGTIDVQASMSGRKYVLTGYPAHEAYFAWPFGLDFHAGHGIVWGSMIPQGGDAPVGTDTLVAGWQAYVRKEIGSMYAKAALSALWGTGITPDYTITLAFGSKT